jgi:MSHA biogenesis protein MshJ
MSTSAFAHLMAPIDDAWMRLRAQVRRFTRRFDGRARRERIAMLFAAAALTYWVADHAWITPAFERSRAAAVKLATARQDLATLRADEQRARTTGAEQQRALEAEIAQWRARLQADGEVMQQRQSTLVSPDQMVEVLQQMLPHDGKLKLVDLHSLGRDELGADGRAKPANPAPGTTAPGANASGTAVHDAAAAGNGPVIYRHGVELTLEGSWNDLVDYLRALEHMPRRVLWGGLSMKVDRYPTVVLTVRLYTLSLDRGWLEL